MAKRDHTAIVGLHVYQMKRDVLVERSIEGNSFAKQFALRLFAPPIAIPAFRVVQAWHTRYDADPAHEWLRRVLKEVGQEV